MSGTAFLGALSFALCLLQAGRPVNAQGRTEQAVTQPAELRPRPTNCENHIAMLEAAHHDAGKDGLIIIIAWLGDGESRQGLNRRRLHNARAYLAEYLNLRAPGTIVTAEGERVKGYGRIELYVGGRLYHVLALRRNADLIVGSCEPETLDDAKQKRLRLKLYPWRDRTPRRH